MPKSFNGQRTEGKKEKIHRKKNISILEKTTLLSVCVYACIQSNCIYLIYKIFRKHLLSTKKHKSMY